jgi:hypothetical protein
LWSSYNRETYLQRTAAVTNQEGGGSQYSIEIVVESRVSPRYEISMNAILAIEPDEAQLSCEFMFNVRHD